LAELTQGQLDDGTMCVDMITQGVEVFTRDSDIEKKQMLLQYCAGAVTWTACNQPGDPIVLPLEQIHTVRVGAHSLQPDVDEDRCMYAEATDGLILHVYAKSKTERDCIFRAICLLKKANHVMTHTMPRSLPHTAALEDGTPKGSRASLEQSWPEALPRESHPRESHPRDIHPRDSHLATVTRPEVPFTCSLVECECVLVAGAGECGRSPAHRRKRASSIRVYKHRHASRASTPRSMFLVCVPGKAATRASKKVCMCVCIDFAL
jgi:hypothetical protein